ncbi:phospholipase D family protein (plasmid) [Klebsiella sp. WOUb02]|uniref:phospholipase D family protein n=1 Tax=Klebsiella sp. WOUb02 TaxID=3161071 RepID=UPI003CEEA349
MVQILNTTGLNYHLEQTICNAEERIILISPYLKLSARIRELIEDKNRMKVDIRIIYGKSELNPKDHEWLVSLPYVRLSFCQNLHAKFYANESQSLICSLNLYDFSQINNHELGVLIVKEEDRDAYNSSISEAQRLIRISTENIPLPTSLKTENLEPKKVIDTTKDDKKGSEASTEAPESLPAETADALGNDDSTVAESGNKLTSSNLTKNRKCPCLSYIQSWSVPAFSEKLRVSMN